MGLVVSLQRVGPYMSQAARHMRQLDQTNVPTLQQMIPVRTSMTSYSLHSNCSGGHAALTAVARASSWMLVETAAIMTAAVAAAGVWTKGQRWARGPGT